MRILVCPLDWGLGHATRCIPLVLALLENGHQVRIGASGGGLRLLREEFPHLDVFEFPGYPVRYSRTQAFFLPVMLAQLPRVLLGIRAESRRLKRILAGNPADLVISDGRYGVSARGIPSIFVTHQVFIKVPGRFPGAGLLERILLSMNLRRLKAFDRVWVPDFPGPDSLSGELSHGASAPDNLEFIHPLSRFGKRETASDPKVVPARDGIPKVDILAVVSGPEPQRGLFEAALRRQMTEAGGTRVLVRGLPGNRDNRQDPASIRPGELTEIDHLPGKDLARLFAVADLVVARSGYTTVMELAGLGARAALLVPTPGQSEQEYLADHLARSGAALRMDQSALDLAGARERLRGLKGFSGWNPSTEPGFTLSAFIASHPLFARAGSPSGTISVPKSLQQ
ncbi:MAG: glycosyltransferase [Fibrobacteres bacterium]|nr:glycosyltransferase [Fibrobacterota bacterium]